MQRRHLLFRLAAIAALLLGLASPAEAQSRNQIDQRIRQLGSFFDLLMIDEQTRIPPGVLRQAKGIIVLKEYKAGFILGASGGHGFAMVRRADGWSPPAFLRTGEGSIGLQLGGQRRVTVILIMNDDGMRVFTQARFRIGVDARAIAGPVGRGAEARLNPDIPMLVYGASEGLYAGATVEGGLLLPDDRANNAYYRDGILTMRDILFGSEAKPTPAAGEFVGVINRWESSQG